MNKPAKKLKPDQIQQIINDVCRDKHDVFLRKSLNGIVRDALHHFYAHKNTSVLNNIINKIPDRDLKMGGLKYFAARLPFNIDTERYCLVIDKEKMSGLTPKIIDRFNFMDAILLKKDANGVIHLDCKDLGVDEFVSWLADTLTLRRREFSKENIEYLAEVLSMVQGRKNMKEADQEGNK